MPYKQIITLYYVKCGAAQPCMSGYGSTPGTSDWDSVLKQVSPGVSVLTSMTPK